MARENSSEAVEEEHWAFDGPGGRMTGEWIGWEVGRSSRDLCNSPKENR